MRKKLRNKNNKYFHLVIIGLFALLISVFIPFSSAQSTNPYSHLVDTQWFSFSNGYNSIEVDITPKVGDTDSYYFSNTVYIKNCSSECYAYAGLQTNGYDGSNWIGKMAIFSWWNATSSIAESYGKAVQFGGEGVGQSVRIPYDWKIGRSYHLKIYLETNGSSKLWGASVKDMTSNVTTRIGRIYSPAGYGLIYGPVTFHERYGGPQATCKTVAPSQVRFSNMTANNGSIKATSWNHYYKATLPGCADYFWTKEDKTGYTSSIGVKKSANPIAEPTRPVEQTPQPSDNEIVEPKKPQPETSDPINKEIPDLKDPITPDNKNTSNIWPPLAGILGLIATYAVIGFIFYKKLH